MTETNDYEKAKQECWETSPYVIPSNAFNFVFDRAYMLGKAHAQPANELAHGLANVRLQVAAMAMQGLLANGPSNSAEFIAKRAVSYADALLTELNKEKE